VNLTREMVMDVILEQGLYGSKEGENVYQHLLPLTEGDVTGPEVVQACILCESISSNFSALQALLKVEVI